MKNLFLTTALLMMFTTAHAQQGQTSNPELDQAVSKLQKVLDENGIDCRFKLQPIRNLGRLIFASTLKLSGSCEDKENTKISAMVKLKFNEEDTVIKKFTLTFKNLSIPNAE